MQFCASSMVIFQSRSVLDAVLGVLHGHFSIKECSVHSSGSLEWSFFDQEVFLMQFRPSCTLVFQSRTFLDANSALAHPYASIKNRFSATTPHHQKSLDKGLLLNETHLINRILHFPHNKKAPPLSREPPIFVSKSSITSIIHDH